MSARSDLIGARRIALVGREKELGEVKKRLASPPSQPTIWYLKGKGGIGKTAFLEETLRRAQRYKKNWIVGQPIIDLYYSEYHTPTGLADRIIEVLGYRRYFNEYEGKKQEADQAFRDEDIEKGEGLLKEAWEAFAQGLNRLAKEKPILLAFDTAEVLEQIRDPFQEEIRDLPTVRSGEEGSSLIDIGRWLIDEILPRLRGRILILLAARPSPLSLRMNEIRRKGWTVERITLGALSKEASREYIERVAQLVRDEGDEIGAKRLEHYLLQYAPALYLGTGGHPILLAMVADIVRAGGTLPDLFYQNQERSSPLSREEREEIEMQLVAHLMGLASPLGETLRAMGLLRRGVNAALLARLEGISEEEARNRLTDAARLTLVKERKAWGKELPTLPYFLHDEIYYMLARYRHIADEERRRVTEVVCKYYDEEETALQEKFRQGEIPWLIFHPRHQVLQAERLHYRIWAEPWEGFTEYFRRAEEALGERDRDQDALLRAEWLRTLDDLKKIGRLPDGLKRVAEADAAVRWGIRALFLRENPREARDIFKRVRKWAEGQLGPISSYHLDLYEAVALLRTGNREDARNRLEGLRGQLEIEIQKLEKPQTPEEKARKQIFSLLRGYVWNYLGYLDRMEGRLDDAARRYQRASLLLRRLASSAAIQAMVNQTYVMTIRGHFRRGRETIREAWKLAQEAGSPHLEARVLNTWAILETLDGHFLDAQTLTDDALRLLERAPNPRLLGLVRLQRARTHRYRWNALVAGRKEREIKNWVILLDAYEEIFGRLGKAEEKGFEGAVQLLAKVGKSVDYFEALVEGGCVLREMAWLCRKIVEWEGIEQEWPSTECPPCDRSTGLKDLGEAKGDHWIRIFANACKRAEQELLRAAGIERAEEDEKKWEEQANERAKDLGSPYLPALALVNLGWHYHYQRKEPSQVQKCLNVVERLIPDDYHIEEEKPRPQIRRPPRETTLWGAIPKDQERDISKAEIGRAADVRLWAVLAKAEMLRFHEALRDWNHLSREKQEERLKEAVWHATLSLEYNGLMGDEHYDLRRAETGLTNRLLLFPERDWIEWILPKFYEFAQEALKQLDPNRESELWERGTVLLWFLAERYGPYEEIVQEGGREW